MPRNSFYAFFLIVLILFSLFTATFIVLKSNSITGKANNMGNISLQIESGLSIILWNETIDFGVGYVNTTRCSTNATLNAGQTYNDTEGVDCWTDNGATPTSFVIENVGRVNATIDISGPNPKSFFNNYTGSNPYNITWRARNQEAGSCNSGLSTTYKSFDETEQRACSDLLDEAFSDTLAIDISITIPADLPSGTYENSTIEFTALQS